MLVCVGSSARDDASRARCSMSVTHALFKELWEFDTGSGLLQRTHFVVRLGKTGTLSVGFWNEEKNNMTLKIAKLSLFCFSMTTSSS